VACGRIEIANNVGGFEKGIYINTSIKISKALEEKFCN